MGLAMPYGRYAVLVEGQNMCNNGYMNQILAESICSGLGKRIWYETTTM